MDILFTAFIAAMVHVLSGPDHLAAVAPLVLDSRKKHWKIGFLWGSGHVIGMLGIGILFFLFKDALPLEKFSAYNERFVGLILISVGLWALYRIKHHAGAHAHPHIHQEGTNRFVHIHKHRHTGESHEHRHDEREEEKSIPRMALFIGIIHGFAGISHFILMLPVLGYHSRLQSVAFMFGFALGIISAMLIFSILIGSLKRIKSKSGNQQLLMYFRLGGGILAILVGIYWLLF